MRASYSNYVKNLTTWLVRLNATFFAIDLSFLRLKVTVISKAKGSRIFRSKVQPTYQIIGLRQYVWASHHAYYGNVCFWVMKLHP